MVRATGTSTPALELRFAEESDVPLILSFIKALAEYEKLSHEVVADAKTLRQSLFGERRVAEVVIAEYAGSAAGFALFFHNYSTFLGQSGIYLEDLYVLPELREKGIGRALLRFLGKLAVERGCGRLEWAVLDWNKPAIAFYQRLGARSLDDWTVFRLTGPTLVKLADEA